MMDLDYEWELVNRTDQSETNVATLLESLRAATADLHSATATIGNQADTIERQRAEIDRLRGLLDKAGIRWSR